LGPLLFVSYTAELADLAAKYGVKLHAFANDSHIHVHCDFSNVLSSVKLLEQCISAISQWMSANRLKLNADKTELMWAGTKYTVASLLHDRDLTMTIEKTLWQLPTRCVFWAFSLHRTSHLRSTQRRLALSASINCLSCDVYDAHLTVTVQLH